MTTEIVQTELTTLAYNDQEQVDILSLVVKKVAPWAAKMTRVEIGLSVRRCMSMGVDPLNGREVQVWKDKRGTLNVDFHYSLITQWVKTFHGDHTAPQYTRMTKEELTAKGNAAAHGYTVSFIMLSDIVHLEKMVTILGDVDAAMKMFTATGTGTATIKEYNGQFFAPAGRTKDWKIKKRALKDAYISKFGDPPVADIIKLRRQMGYEITAPEDWEDTAGLAPADAAALAKENAHRREHPASPKQNSAAAGALFNGYTEVKPPQEAPQSTPAPTAIPEDLYLPETPQDAPQTAQTAPEPIPERPTNAAAIKARLLAASAAFVALREAHLDDIMSDADPNPIEPSATRRGTFAGSLGKCFAGNTAAKRAQRVLVTWWIFNTTDGSSKTMTSADISAWSTEYIGAGTEEEKYPLREYAAREMAMCHAAALQAAGQMELEEAAQTETEEERENVE